MSEGAIDLFTSRRVNNLKCEYWNLTNSNLDVDRNKFVYENKPSGFFTATEGGEYSESSQRSSVFLVDTNSLSLITSDDISDLKVQSIIKIDGNKKLWRVVSISKTPIKRISYLSNDSRFTYYLTLKG